VGIEVKNAEVILRLVKEKLEKAKARLKGALEDEATRIVLRTRSGLDVDGKPFARYSDSYNQFKAKFRSGFITRTGKRGKNARQLIGKFSATPQQVDLTLSGQMLNAIQTKVETTPEGATGTIFFNSTEEAVKAQGNQKKRQFFGLSDEQVQRIKAKLTE
jgi:hypothetical protein